MLTTIIPFLISIALTYFLIYYSHKKKVFIDCHESDKPQRFHDVPTPRVGGLAIFVASISLIWHFLGFVVAFAASIAFFSGIIEDMKGNISQKTRLLIQSIAALVFVIAGGYYLKTVGMGVEFPYFIAVLFTVFAIVGVTNSINIIDGLNGLASGVSMGAFAVFGIFSLMLGDLHLMWVCAVLFATTLGFFVFNFPAGKIFLGDGGAYYLGFMLSAISVLTVVRHPEVSAWFCLAVVIYPIWEVVFSIYRRRKLSGKKATEPDKMHFHQVFMRSRRLANFKAALLIILCFSPFQSIALFVYNTGYLAFLISVIFIICYQFAYSRYSANVKKDKR